ncbi:DUF1501 domain-containing protein [Novipirellula sp. SH528]|uniref:DUF1501 domain-containing protein n=1 Tax=Novipirellula sp. SH528 TaxID=3454466 RepID=UPI003FA154CD
MNDPMNPLDQFLSQQTRRHFFSQTARGIGAAALGSLLAEDGLAAPASAFPSAAADGGLASLPHFAPRAKRVIYLFQSGGPSQMDLFDHKPMMDNVRGEDLPDSIRRGQRLTGMSSGQAKFPVANSIYKFQRHGQSGATVSELMPHIASVADDLCFIKSMHTEQINHDPAITFFQTGFQIAGRPSIGSWMSYGLGSGNRDLPSFIAMTSRGTGRPSCQPLYDRLWGAGFMPTSYAGVKLRSAADPVLFLQDPPGMPRSMRRDMLDELAQLNERHMQQVGDAEIQSRISQYELAYRMQASVPELTDISDEPEHVLEMYGPDVRKPGTFAANALLARRLAERDVRFVQLFHMGWDQHGNLPKQLPGQCHDVDQASAALVKDLKQRGMLDDTLVVWGGEFGRTIYSQGQLTETNYGRDHHPRCFTIWMAGGGIKPGITHGETDDYSYNVVRDPVSVHDLHATILNQLGVNHERLTYRFQGRDYRLTDVHGEVINAILA